MNTNSKQIGGPSCVVEIGIDNLPSSIIMYNLLDESMFGKRKYNRGRLKNQMWILGGVCRLHSNVESATKHF